MGIILLPNKVERELSTDLARVRAGCRRKIKQAWLIWYKIEVNTKQAIITCNSETSPFIISGDL